MNGPEYRVQYLETEAQWTDGALIDRVRLRPRGGIELRGLPGPATRTTRLLGQDIEGLAADPCGRIFGIDAHGGVSSWDGADGVLRRASLDAVLGHAGTRFDGARIGIIGDLWWVLVPALSRAYALDARGLQVLRTMEPLQPGDWYGLDRPVDLAVTEERAWVLDRRRLYWMGHADGSRGHYFGYGELSDPRALAVHPAGSTVWIADGEDRLVRLRPETNEKHRLVDLDAVAPGFRPDLLKIVASGELVTAVRSPDAPGAGALHVFDPDGQLVGQFPLPVVDGSGTDERPVALRALAATAGGIAIATEVGLALHGDQRAQSGATGTYVTRTLDSGSVSGERWHRIEIDARIPPGAVLEVSYASTEGLSTVLAESLRAAVEGQLRLAGSPADRRTEIDALLAERWSEPEVYPLDAAGGADGGDGIGAGDDARPLHLLLRRDTGRYLWVRLTLRTFATSDVPSVERVRFVHPRRSYLRYLPEVYSEDPAGRAFLERFLSVFETVLGGLDGTIDRLSERFDPRTAAEAHLPWLASWVGLDVQRSWSERARRELVLRAGRLVTGRGTAAGLAAAVEAVTGGCASVLESPGADCALVVGSSRLGIGSALPPRRRRATRLDGTALLGRTWALSAEPDPVAGLSTVERPEVLLDVEPDQYERVTSVVTQLFREHAPAHVRPRLRFVPREGMRLGVARIGIDFRLAAPRTAHVGRVTVGGGVPASSGGLDRLGRTRLGRNAGPQIT